MKEVMSLRNGDPSVVKGCMCEVLAFAEGRFHSWQAVEGQPTNILLM
jgi:hypothetical protein